MGDKPYYRCSDFSLVASDPEMRFDNKEDTELWFSIVQYLIFYRSGYLADRQLIAKPCQLFSKQLKKVCNSQPSDRAPRKKTQKKHGVASWTTSTRPLPQNRDLGISDNI